MAISFARESSQPRDWRTRVSRIVGSCFYRLNHQGSRNRVHDDCSQNSPPNEDAPPVSCLIAKSTRPRADCCTKEVGSEATEGVSWAQSACNAGDLGSISGLGRSPGEGNGHPLQYSCLENPMDWRAWWATVHRVSKESDKTERLHFHLTKFLSFLVCSFTHWANKKKKKFFFKIFGVWTIFLKSLPNSLPYCFYIVLYCFIFWFLSQGACGSKSPALKVKVPTPGPPGKPLEPTNISWASTVRRGEWRKWALIITELTNYRRRVKMKHSIQMFHLKKCHRRKLRSAEGQRGNEVRCCTFISSGQRRKHLSKGLKEVRSKPCWAVVKDG